MIQEQKQLLLKDLCGRLPYGVKYQDRIEGGIHILSLDIIHHYERFIPYLRSMNSMTEEEKDELYTAMDWYGEIDENGNVYTNDQEKVYRETFYEYTDWLNKNHFDWRGLIPMGLALKAPEGMYKTE